MTRQRNKFMTFLFSLIPGCGQMFMGFMKRGLSLLALFIAGITVSSILNFMELGAFCILIWCWAFFDSLGLMSMAPEKFAATEDDFVIVGKNSDFPKLKIPSNKLLRLGGIALVVFGAFAIWNMIFDALYSNLYGYNTYLAQVLYNFNYYLPRIAISAVIIVVGFKLIGRKKVETQNDEVSFDDTEK